MKMLEVSQGVEEGVERAGGGREAGSVAGGEYLQMVCFCWKLNTKIAMFDIHFKLTDTRCSASSQFQNPPLYLPPIKFKLLSLLNH